MMRLYVSSAVSAAAGLLREVGPCQTAERLPVGAALLSGLVVRLGGTVESQMAGDASVVLLVFERQPQPDAVARDLAFLDRDVEAGGLGDAEIANRAGCGLDSIARRRFPRVGADPDHLSNAVDGIAHLPPLGAFAVPGELESVSLVSAPSRASERKARGGTGRSPRARNARIAGVVRCS